MPKNKTIIPNAPVCRLMKISGARRVSMQAVKELSLHIQSQGIDLAKKAVTLSKHAGRSTINSQDIRLSQR
jgi:histone H3/H4